MLCRHYVIHTSQLVSFYIQGHRGTDTSDNSLVISSRGLWVQQSDPSRLSLYHSVLLSALTFCGWGSPCILRTTHGVQPRVFFNHGLDGVSTYNIFYIKLGTLGCCLVFLILKKNWKSSFSPRFLGKCCLRAPSLAIHLTLIPILGSGIFILLFDEYTTCIRLGSADLVQWANPLCF